MKTAKTWKTAGSIAQKLLKYGRIRTITDAKLKQKYVEAIRRLHICSPASKADLKILMNFYYSEMVKRGIA